MMMHFTLSIENRSYLVQLDQVVSLAIPLHFRGSQPNCFDAPYAHSESLQYNSFVADTRQGGSCNVDCLSLIPHCNGTHTESIGHIVNDPIHINACLKDHFIPAQLLSLTPSLAEDVKETYDPPLNMGDQIISCAMLQESLDPIPSSELKGLIIRTLPNDRKKCTYHYGRDIRPPFFSIEAMLYLNTRGVQHLLFDCPSIDRLDDDGRLVNHHLFWQVERRSCRLDQRSERFKTITELIYADNAFQDSLYLLSIHLPFFETDAAPSQPMLYPLLLIEN